MVAATATTSEILVAELEGLVLMTSVVRTENVTAELLAWAPQGIATGAPVSLGLRIQHRPKWHTYWKNPGDSGLPTTVSWEHPDGILVGPIQWPTPERMSVGPLVNYGYEGDLLLPVSVEIPPGFAAETLDVKLQAKWLVCEEICIPESGRFALSIPANQPTVEHVALFAAAKARLPDPSSRLIELQASEETLSFQVDNLPAEMHGHDLRFMPATTGVFDYAAPIQQRWMNGSWIATVPVSSQRTKSPAIIEAVLVDAARPAGVEIRLDASRAWPNSVAETTVDPTPSLPTTQSWSAVWIGLGFAIVLITAVVYLLNRSKP